MSWVKAGAKTALELVGIFVFNGRRLTETGKMIASLVVGIFVGQTWRGRIHSGLAQFDEGFVVVFC